MGIKIISADDFNLKVFGPRNFEGEFIEAVKIKNVLSPLKKHHLGYEVYTK